MRREGFSEWELWARCPRMSLHSASGCVARQVEAGRSRWQAFCVPPGRVGCTEGYAGHKVLRRKGTLYFSFREFILGSNGQEEGGERNRTAQPLVL